MNIGIVCYPTYGGSGIVATELAKGLAKKGHSVHVIASEQPVRLDVFKQNLYYHEVPAPNYPLFSYVPYESALTSAIVDIAKHAKLDLLHVHYALPHASVAYMAQQILATEGISLPYITTLHGTDITVVGRDDSYEPVISFAINHADAVTAVSQSLKDSTNKYFKVHQDIEVIPNFVNFEYCERFTHENNIRENFVSEDEMLLVHVSNLRKVKRVEDVIKVFQRVHNKLAAKLLIVGDGPERSHLEHQVRALGLEAHVYFLGKIKKIEKILRAADLFLLPSEQESFGLAALEAMAAGVPVIASNAGGLPEVIVHGETGYLADVGDVTSMADYAIGLLTDQDQLKLYRTQAKTHAKQYCIHHVLPRYEALYESVVSRQ